jgi:ribosomal protein S18 acetylase RimI-like enzyme
MPTACAALVSPETEQKGPPIGIRDLQRAELPSAAELVARALRDDPMFDAVFGADADHRFDRLHRFFDSLLPTMGQAPLSAWEANRLVGVLGFFPPGKCNPPLAAQMRIAYRMLSCNLAEMWRFWHWHQALQRYPLPERHCYLGVVAVDVGWQRRGIGGLMLKTFCARMDERGENAFLETNKLETVRLYRRFGFDVAAKAEVLGTPNWWMRRRAWQKSGSRAALRNP